MFEDEVHFDDGFDRYVATARTWGRGVPVDDMHAVRALLAVLHAGRLDGPLLELLRLEEHPANMHPSELEERVRTAVQREWLVIHALSPPSQPRRRAAQRAPELPLAIEPRAATELASLVVEVRARGGKALGGVALEIIAPDATVQTVRVGAEGSVRLDGLIPGTCRVRLPHHDASAWRGLSGTAQQAERRSSRSHAVLAGECLSTIAHDYGLSGWKPVWEHPENEALRAKRSSPHVIRPGDVVIIPGLQMAELACATNATHQIEVDVPVLELKVALADHLGRPFKSQPFELWLDQCEGEPHRQGSTDGAGRVDEKLPRGTCVAFVLLTKQGLMFPLQLSAVPALPQSEAATRADVLAIQARLNALGIGAGPVTGSWNAANERALRNLRRARGDNAHQPLVPADLEALRAFGV